MHGALVHIMCKLYLSRCCSDTQLTSRTVLIRSISLNAECYLAGLCGFTYCTLVYLNPWLGCLEYFAVVDVSTYLPHIIINLGHYLL